MGSSEETFSLKWNDFQESISSSLGDLLHCADLQDVSLQCGHQTLQCHRLVLAACSDWFRQIFKTLSSSNTRHPVIVLWDAAARDMSLLLEFMYNGVVSVKQEHLNSFLALAERLSVRGLTQTEKSEESQQKQSSSQQSSQTSRPSRAHHHTSSSSQAAHSQDVIEEVPVVKQEQEQGGYQEQALVQYDDDTGGYDEVYYDDGSGAGAMEYDNSGAMVNSKGKNLSHSLL